jgi:mRNA interferase RelE/StbE
LKTEFKKSFAKDLKKRSQEKKLLTHVQEIIEAVEQVERLEEINNFKKITALGDYYRIRLGDYRIGLKIEQETVVFVRFLHRSEIYRYFP